MEKLKFRDFSKYSSLKGRELLVYNCFIFILGSTPVPKMVHIKGIMVLAEEKGFKMTYRQTKYNIHKLVKKGFLDRWTVKFDKKKHSYYRLKL